MLCGTADTGLAELYVTVTVTVRMDSDGWRELGDLLYSVYYLSLPLQTVLTVVTENLLLRAAGQLFG